MLHAMLRFFSAAMAMIAVPACFAQSLPSTAAETLSGKPIVLADAVHGRTAVLVAGFSRKGGMVTGDWIKAIHADPAFANASVFQIAELAGAPGFMRGIIRSGMKKGLSVAEQDRFVILTGDEKPWRTFFDVTTDKEPYVVLLDAHGKILWHGHGYPANLETQMRAALH
ncbi:MAG: hypothetical protein ACLPH3_02180 [Terracidiphilus sp.]